MRSAVVLALLVLGCNGAAVLPGPRQPARVAPNAPPRSDRDSFESLRFASVPAGTFGPYVSDTKSGGVALWAQPHESARAWFGVGFDAQGQPRGPAAKLAPAASEIGLAVVEPALGGFALLSTHKDGAQTLLDSLELHPNGRARAAPMTLTAVSGEIVWIDLVSTSHGALALWGVKSPDGADLFAALLGRERVEPKPFAKGARAWQAASFGNGAAVGLVLSGAKDAAGGKVLVQTLDEEGAPAARVVVSASPTADSVLDMVGTERGLLLAWSDRKDFESRVVLAALDGTGNVTRPPTALAGVLGEQALVRLVPPHESGGNAYLAWENLLERPTEGRAIVLAPVSRDGTVGSARATLDHAARDGSVPELAATADGLAALTLARACKNTQDCAAAPLVPTYVELGDELQVTSSGPLAISSLKGGTPDLAWGLSCATHPCRVVAAQAVSPAPVFAVKVAGHRTDFVPAARRADRAVPPRVAALEVLAKTDPLSDVALSRLGSTSLSAWVTFFDPSAPLEKMTKPAPDGRLDPVRALLQVRAIPESGAALPPETISIRARSLGGVALAASASGPAEALLGWTAFDFKLPQVFLTVVDDKGKKLRQRVLTRGPGEKTDVAVAGVGDGWIVAWIDERSGDAEVYAARVNRLLQNAGPEKRLTQAAGAASEVALLARGQDALVAWSDARDKEHPGVGDIYVALLKGADASLAGGEQVVAKTPQHSRSPALGAYGKGALLAWIEESISATGEAADAQARVVELGADGHPVGTSTPLTTKGGSPTAVALDCQEGHCRVLLTSSRDATQELWVSEWAEGKASTPVRLMSLTSPAPLAIAPGFLGREIIVADRAGNEGRARRLLIDWK